MIGLSIGIGFAKFIGQSGPPNPITGSGPVLAALTDGDMLSSAVTWGSYSGTGTVTTTQQMRVDAGSWVTYDGDTVVAEGEVWQIRELCSDDLVTDQAFESDTQEVAEASAAPIISEESYTAPNIFAESDQDGTVYAKYHSSSTILDADLISGATASGPTVAGAIALDVGSPPTTPGTYWLVWGLQNGSGQMTQGTPVEIVVSGPNFVEDWSGFSVGNTFTEVDATYTRNQPQLTVSIATDASGPDGKRCEVSSSAANERHMSRDDMTAALALRTTERIQWKALLRMASLANGRGYLGYAVDATNLHTGITVSRGASTWSIGCQLEGSPNTLTNNTAALTGVADGALVRVIGEVDGLDIKVKAYLDGDPVPGSWTTRTAAGAITFPELQLGARTTGLNLNVLGFNLAIGADAEEV